MKQINCCEYIKYKDFQCFNSKIGGGVWYTYSELHKVCSRLDEVYSPLSKCEKMYL